MHGGNWDAELFLGNAGAQYQPRGCDDQNPRLLMVRDEIVNLPHQGQHPAPRHERE